MTHPSDDERSGGRLTFSAFLVLGLTWMCGAVAATGTITTAAVAGLAIAIIVGGIIGMFIGFYNLGRERGR